jgi:type II secretory pathway pseudopilin PulG
MKKSSGFTVIELLVIIVVMAVGGWLFFNEKATVSAVQRDNQRKTAINAMYYSLEEVFYDKNHYYPQAIDSKTLRAVDPTLFNDPEGNALGTSGSDYRYDATGCTTDGHCTGYTLQSTMERESAFVKTNRSH